MRRFANRVYYHGTSREGADYLLPKGFGKSKRFSGMSSSVPDEWKKFTYLAKTKKAAQFYSENNLRFEGGVVLVVGFNGRVLKLKYRGDNYGAMMEAGRILGIDVDKNNPRGTVPTKEIVDKLKENGYSAIDFFDNSSGFDSVLVVEPNKIDLKRG